MASILAAAPSYYHTIQAQFSLLEQIEALDGEMTQEVQELFSLNADRIQHTTERMLELRDTVTTLIDGSDKAIAREQAIRARHEASMALLDRRLRDAVEIVGPVTVGTRTVSLKTSIATEILDAELIPTEYQRTVPAVPAVPAKQLPDGVKILSALKKNVFIPGAKKKENITLQIK